MVVKGELLDRENPAGAAAEREDDSTFMHVLHMIRPLLLALLVDGADVVGAVPGVNFLAIPAAALLAWGVTSSFKMPRVTQIAISLMAAIYCALPGTELIPLATILTAVAGVTRRTKA